MNVLDVVIIAVVAFGAWMGYRKGAILELARIVGLALAFILAVQMMNEAGMFLSVNFNLPEEIAPALGFALVFGVVILFVFIISKIVTYMIGEMKLGGVNRAFGSIIGGGKWALILSVTLLLLSVGGMPSSSMRNGSLLYGGVSNLASQTWDTLSQAVNADNSDIADMLRAQPVQEDETTEGSQEPTP